MENGDIFNTVRLGGRLGSVLTPGCRVVLVERPKSIVLGCAVIQYTKVGTLREIADRYAHLNHNQKGKDREGAPDRLIAGMIKRYGPHKCGENSKVSMILLHREDLKICE